MNPKKVTPKRTEPRLFLLLKKYRYAVLGSLVILAILYWSALPNPLFQDSYCATLEDRTGQLLGARIAKDGQWRFPVSDSIPQRYISALLTFEDKRFYAHPGVDIRALGRATLQNLRAGRIVSGGSTISMQLIRLSRKGKKRTLSQKIIEILLATRLELSYSKAGILNLYAAHAPFGGNVVGLEAASWRYFGKSPHLISWAEASLLAVLPNSPSLMHPGRNREQLTSKRNRLLYQLLERGAIDQITYELSLEEPLPEAPMALPRQAPHLLNYLIGQANGQQKRFPTTIDASLQQQANRIVRQHQEKLAFNQIHNAAVLIVHIPSGEVRAYIGNADNAGAEHNMAVDIIQAPRSTGSILKPFLYAFALDEGLILPHSLLQDTPINLKGYRPENYNRDYQGVVAASEALARSLNVPFVNLLKEYGTDKFHHRLKALGMQTFTQTPEHYGLSIILGGGEARLSEITQAYVGMARTLNTFTQESSQYRTDDFQALRYLQTKAPLASADAQQTPSLLSAGACWQTLQAMHELIRPDEEGDWERFASSRSIAWKTGTSFGFRDAWAVGLTPEYAVGVWVGNADGEGRPGLVGVKAAGPLLFDIFDLLPATPDFSKPHDDLYPLLVCRESGYQAGRWCTPDTLMAVSTGERAPSCPYHQLIHLAPKTDVQVNSSCMSPDSIRHVPWFVLPPLSAFYYKKKTTAYREVPPFDPTCKSTGGSSEMEFIYPRNPTRVYIPRDYDGQASRTVFEVAHRRENAQIHWHLDEQYLGVTQQFHSFELGPDRGMHRLVLVDEQGNRLEQYFEVIERQ